MKKKYVITSIIILVILSFKSFITDNTLLFIIDGTIMTINIIIAAIIVHIIIIIS